MTSELISPQTAMLTENRDANEHLYHFINKYVKRVSFSRLKIEPDEIASEVYLRLIEITLPNFGTDEFRITVLRMIKRIVWDHRRPVRRMLDVDELEEKEHPFYEMDFFSEEQEFELYFSKFCESFPEPRRTVFAKSRVLTKQQIADLTGLGRNTVAQEIKAMPELFRTFLESSKNI